ncbi:MAG: SLC13 family permease [bacterium]
MKIPAFLIFIICYVLLASGKGHKALIVWMGTLILLVLGAISLPAAGGFINWNVLGIFWGTLVVAEIFIESKVPAYLAHILVGRSKTVWMAILAVCALSGFISTFVENVATVLIVAPVALEIAKKLKVSPVPFIVGISVSSNLQGAATLVGDPPSMILAGFANMNFNDFFFMHGKPGIFFAVELSAIGSFLVLYFLFRKYSQRVDRVQMTEVSSWVPTAILFMMILALALSSFAPGGLNEVILHNLPGIICTLFGIGALGWYVYRRRDADKTAVSFFRDLDWETFFFLMGLFILVGSLVSVGLIGDLAAAIATLTGKNVFMTYFLVVWLSVLFSAFIDNVPYILAMLPLTQTLSQGLGISPYLLYFGLLIGASLGGNITPIGASANIVGCGLLRKNGYKVSFSEFVRIGLPFTVSAVLIASAFIWIIWS